MESDKSAFLADLESELMVTQESPKPTRAARKPRLKAYWLAVVLAIASPMVVVGPSPASASNCTSPNAVNYTHTKYCSLGTYQYIYTGATVYYHARTICYHFHAYAWMCGFTSRYDRGMMEACKYYG